MTLIVYVPNIQIEYDHNRSSWIALVPWIEGVQLRPQRKCNTINTIEEDLAVQGAQSLHLKAVL